MKKILHLTLYKKWFDLVAEGAKIAEYRQNTPYWRKRLLDENGFGKLFDEIHFRNGYGKTRPLVVTGHICTFVTHSGACDPQHGEELGDTTVIVIGLGLVLRGEHLHNDNKVMNNASNKS